MGESLLPVLKVPLRSEPHTPASLAVSTHDAETDVSLVLRSGVDCKRVRGAG